MNINKNKILYRPPQRPTYAFLFTAPFLVHSDLFSFVVDSKSRQTRNNLSHDIFFVGEIFHIRLSNGLANRYFLFQQISVYTINSKVQEADFRHFNSTKSFAECFITLRNSPHKIHQNDKLLSSTCMYNLNNYIFRSFFFSVLTLIDDAITKLYVDQYDALIKKKTAYKFGVNPSNDVYAVMLVFFSSTLGCSSLTFEWFSFAGTILF